MTAVAPPLFGGPVPAIDPGMVPGDPDESSLITADMHPPVDLAEDLERFNGKLATYLKPEEIARVGAAFAHRPGLARGRHRLQNILRATVRAIVQVDRERRS